MILSPEQKSQMFSYHLTFAADTHINIIYANLHLEIKVAIRLSDGSFYLIC
jgi:hypothetical protein